MVRRLKNHPSFEADDPSLAAKELAKSYVDHQVIVAPGEKIRAIHHQAELSTISINYLEYGAEVGISTNKLEDFYLLQIPIAGSTSNQSEGSEQLATLGSGFVIACDSSVSQQWSADCCQIQIKIDRKALEQHLNRLLGSPIKEPLCFNLMMDFTEPKAASWWRFIEFIISEFETGDSTMTIGPAVAHIESTIIINLLTAQPHNYSQALTDMESGVVPVHVKKAEQYIRDHISQSITIDDLVKVCEVSERALYDGFRRFRHTTPMNYQRSHRMEQVHQDLLKASPDQSVTDIATQWGVSQLGRFASMYKLVYGQSPSDTLKSEWIGN
jgi:AraC-like DNA-binding protein